jgi:hypothetical protein
MTGNTFSPDDLMTFLVQTMQDEGMRQEYAEPAATSALQALGLFDEDFNYREGTYIEVVRL